ncbi:FecR family protein [Erythrobacter mangrovi]|uniref:FecR domain-containing protein n=1 Tax=Erythrobacter mangrovi TaxID=2739433 RepID=A0A7D4BPA0_9SPHN|nr:FecR domain-containing protein [Erythrobacter mangrovi]QKG71764.1 FecR domain-containing protein [Erythrobacter mangrovi]
MDRCRNLAAALIAGTLVLTSFSGTPLMAQERVEVGNAATVVGDVRMSNPQITKPRKIERKQRLAWGDMVDTAKKSQLQILLLDRSTFGIGASSRVRIDRYVYDPEKGRSVFMTMIKGALRFLSGRQGGENSAEIQSPSGRIGIRGTALDMLVGENAEDIAEAEEAVGKVDSNKDEATLVVLRGPGAATEGGLTVGLAEVTAAGQTVVLDQPGLAAYIPRNGAPPIGPFFISNPGLAKLQDELAPEVARAAKGGRLLKALLPIAGAIAIGSILSGNKDETSPAGRVQDSPNDYPTSDVPPRSPNG